MEAAQVRACPGCGLRLPVSDAAADDRYNASPECWQLHGELTGYTVMRGDARFIHQLLVDTYAAQHPLEGARPIGRAFALIGLYLTFKKGYSGRQVQRIHSLLAQRSKQWPPFEIPPHRGFLTIGDVLREEPGETRDAMLYRWGRSVWDAWGAEHERVRTLFDTVMAD